MMIQDAWRFMEGESYVAEGWDDRIAQNRTEFSEKVKGFEIFKTEDVYK